MSQWILLRNNNYYNVYKGLLIIYNRETMKVYYKKYNNETKVEIEELMNNEIISNLGEKKATLSSNCMLRFLLTNKCNLNCTYCQMSKMFDNRFIDISYEKINLILDKVAEQNFNYMTIHFSGGEPLIALNKIEYICERALEKIKCKIRFAMSSNGLLLSDKQIEVIKKYDIQTVVSIDGNTEDNRQRVMQNGKDSNKHLYKALYRVKERDLEIGLSMVYINQDVDELCNYIEELKQDFCIKSLGLNYLHYSGFKKDIENFVYDLQPYANTLWRVYETCKKLGVFEEQSNRLIEPFVCEKPRKSHCSSQTSQITIYPNGNACACKTFLTAMLDTIEFEEYKDAELIENDKVKKWRNRNIDTLSQCKECMVKHICGGGCGYEAYVDYNDIMNADTRYCIVANIIFDKIIYKLIDNHSFAEAELTGLKELSRDEKKKLLSVDNSSDYKLTASIGHMLEVN